MGSYGPYPLGGMGSEAMQQRTRNKYARQTLSAVLETWDEISLRTRASTVVPAVYFTWMFEVAACLHCPVHVPRPPLH